MRRQTGRTTRMLQTAAGEAFKGDYVIVVAANKNQCSELAKELTSKHKGNLVGGDKVYLGSAGGSVSFVPLEDKNIDLQYGHYQGAHSSVKMLADHFALELAFSRLAPWAWNQWESFQE